MSHSVLISVPQHGLLRQIRDFLGEAGHQVVVAATEDAALEILDDSRSELDLLLVDAHGQNAPRLARHAALRRPGMKVLFISGEPEYIGRALIPEAEVGFLERPFAWCELTRKIDELMGAEPASERHTMTASSLV
jgi:DNA-binding response OmpR family regulator